MRKLEPEEVNVFDALASVYAAFRANVTAAVLLLVLFTAGFIALYFFTPETYKSDMVIGTTLLSHQEALSLEKELTSRATFGPDNAHKIEGITYAVRPNEYSLGKEQSLALDKVAQQPQQSVLLNITTVVYDKNDFPVIEAAIMSHISNSALVTRRRQEHTRYYTQIIESIDQELAGLNELTKNLKGNSAGNASDVFLAIVALKKEKTRLQLELEKIREPLVVKSFGTAISSNKRDIMVYALGGIAVALLVFIAYLILRNTISHYRKITAL